MSEVTYTLGPRGSGQVVRYNEDDGSRLEHLPGGGIRLVCGTRPLISFISIEEAMRDPDFREQYDPILHELRESSPPGS